MTRRRHKLPEGTRRVVPMDIDLAAENYLARCRARGLALNTLKSYGTDLMQFVGFAYAQGAGITGLMCDRLAERWLDALDSEGASRRTQARKLTVLRMFARYCIGEGTLGAELGPDVRVRYRAKRVTAPELRELARIFEIIKPTAGWRALRDRALLRLSLDCALRISEPIALDLTLPGDNRPPEFGIDLGTRIARVPGKGTGAQTVQFSETTGQWLAQWVHERAAIARPGERALFISERGTRMHRQTVHTMLRQRAAHAGLSDVHFQLLRHRRIGGVLDKLGDRAASAFARHSHVTTTNEVYGHHAATRTQRMIAEHASLDAMLAQGPTP